ncbi:glycosyltransferase family 4 protein [Flavobacterium restrictum]|uniref:Glycosyltransferase family 4 protein n=1 Tax=Flavobacterium restrictum TaxID=2594428 RepID=A0A553E8U7_9FLAO|nr:glycosyltransferase family 1 protein [Flavobacterium restrictum]TRX41243.1 glycosyltransferase family 4 protein [Flavobacterium restrictum]
MAQRYRVGILYSFNENWIGGSYYIQNLIRSLNYLPVKDQIKLQILTDNKETFFELQKATKYRYLNFIKYKPHYNLIESLINRVSKKFFEKKIIEKKVTVNLVFPLYSLSHDLEHVKKIIFWIPDLQEKFLPNFFSSSDIQLRNTCYEKMISLNHPIVFSSYAAQNDFLSFYPHAKNETKVMQFAVVHPDLNLKTIDEVKEKYAIEGNYFISPNQFWQHKNQIAIIEAARILKEKGVAVQIIFTGKEHDYRNPDYTNNLKQKVSTYGLENEVVFLGFIDRIDQLLLMKNALGVVQPSLFEGWSTVVEDAKALNQTLIVSNIAVHLEQLENKGYYFDPHDYTQLALHLMEVINNPTIKLKYNINYQESIKRFALNFKELIEAN